MFRAPRQLPTLPTILGALGADARELAAHLGTCERTVRYWIARSEAPRPAHLALFYETPWGLSLLDAEAVNAARVARGYADALARENAALRARIARLEAIGEFGSANAPSVTAR